MNTYTILSEMIKGYPNSCIAYNHIDVSNYWGYPEEYWVEELYSLFTHEIMNLCGCGSPELTDDIIRKLLKVRFDYKHNNMAYEERCGREKEIFNIEDEDILYGTVQFFLYVLDDKGMLEHGSSIGGSWITDLGEKYLYILDKHYELEIE